MFSNLRQKENNAQLDKKSAAKDKKKPKHQKYTPNRHPRSQNKTQDRLFTTLNKKTLSKKNQNNANWQALNEENIPTHGQHFNQIEFESIELNEEEILASRQYKELQREYEEENKNHMRQIFRLNYFLEQKDSQTATIKKTINELTTQILELKYQFFALKMMEKDEDEENYCLYKEMEEVVLKMQLKQENEVESSKLSYEININEESDEEVYSESDP